MEIAALILSIIALILSISCLIFVLAKHFSSHQVQMVPVDNFAPLARGMGDDFREIDDKTPPKEIFERF